MSTPVQQALFRAQRILRCAEISLDHHAAYNLGDGDLWRLGDDEITDQQRLERQKLRNRVEVARKLVQVLKGEHIQSPAILEKAADLILA